MLVAREAEEEDEEGKKQVNGEVIQSWREFLCGEEEATPTTQVHEYMWMDCNE